MSEPDWDTYHCKHCVRLYGWLPASKEYLEHARKANIKYFTLSATKAIDIFMFEREGLLARDKSGKLPNVVICEGTPGKVPEIFDVVRPPTKEAIIIGKLQEILTFEDDEYTRITPLPTYSKDRKKRERLRLKRTFDRLRRFFPFDIINFDPCDNLLNPEIANNKLYQALESVFDLQKSTTKFLLFVTTPIFGIAEGTKESFQRDFQHNIYKYPDINEALLSTTGTIEYDKLDDNKQMAFCVAKSIVMRAARNRGWNCVHKGIYIYENEHGNRFLNSVTLCTQASGEPSESSYVEDLVRIILDMPKYYSFSESSSNEQLKEHLNEIVRFREKSRQEYWTV